MVVLDERPILPVSELERCSGELTIVAFTIYAVLIPARAYASTELHSTMYQRSPPTGFTTSKLHSGELVGCSTEAGMTLSIAIVEQDHLEIHTRPRRRWSCRHDLIGIDLS